MFAQSKIGLSDSVAFRFASDRTMGGVTLGWIEH